MSTRSTLFMTSDGEHWWHELSYNEDGETCLVININKPIDVDIDSEGNLMIEISEKTELFNILMGAKY